VTHYGQIYEYGYKVNGIHKGQNKLPSEVVVGPPSFIGKFEGIQSRNNGKLLDEVDVVVVVC
jgi:hypothetical protein